MYFLIDFANKFKLKEQLKPYGVIAREDRIFIDLPDVRLDLYGWPDNRVCFTNKITGNSTIKRFGPKGTYACRKFYIDMLREIGVDTDF